MSKEDLEYIRPEEKIYEVATDRNDSEWKTFLYRLIYKEGLDPWHIDLAVLTKKYLEEIKKLERIDFEISGKLLTIAVYLLKTKSETLVERDLRGIEEKLSQLEQEDEGEESIEDFEDEVEELEEIDQQLQNQKKTKRKKQDYNIKVRNPLARKKRVNIHELIDTLEKTLQQSNKRQENILQRKETPKYNGPVYEKKSKDLKEIIEDLHQTIEEELKKSKKGSVKFSHIAQNTQSRRDVLEKFLPLLHLHSQSRVEISQQEHFGDIHIHKINKDKKE